MKKITIVKQIKTVYEVPDHWPDEEVTVFDGWGAESGTGTSQFVLGHDVESREIIEIKKLAPECKCFQTFKCSYCYGAERKAGVEKWLRERHEKNVQLELEHAK